PNIVLKISLHEGLLPVLADKGNIEQVIMNLVMNAADSMPKGGTLFIKTENVELTEKEAVSMPEARPGNFIKITVSDTGLGMEKAILERIFDPFFSTKGDAGTGLGLSVVYGIITRHDGWIHVRSWPGHGSIFEVYLPAKNNE
ncbi:MAG: hypothetical protein HY880_04695, partial [Deltaproteobacteria bacterium]|nr:hypothetical protein [Deltaproteobacteria bacterium]